MLVQAKRRRVAEQRYKESSTEDWRNRAIHKTEQAQSKIDGRREAATSRQHPRGRREAASSTEPEQRHRKKSTEVWRSNATHKAEHAQFKTKERRKEKRRAR